MSFGSTKLLAASGGKDYEIDQSIMLDAEDAPKLRRTPSSEGNRKTFTFSTWCKRTRLGTGGSSGSDYHALMGAFVSVGSPDDSHYFFFGFYNGNQIVVGGWATNWRITNRLFRDTSAWYHLVLQVDTTQGTADNRIKIYVNGVQETSFSTSSNPSENYDLAINNTVQQAIGDVAYDQGSGPYHFDGYMAETHLFDGAVVAPSEFGETDSDTGQWIPKKYVGSTSYGTNGYYMKFASGAIGTDSSGNGNNYTTTNLGNGDVLLDTPTNNFPIVNPLEPYNTTVSTLRQGTLNIKGAAYSSGNYGNHFASFILPTSGKWYVEMLTGIQAGAGNYAQLGISKQGPNGLVIPNQSQAVYTFSGSTALAITLSGNTADLYDGGSSVDQDTGLTATSYVCALAIDIDNDKVWVGYDGGSSITWLNSGNPATGSNGAAHTFDSDSGIYMAVASSSDNANRSYVIMNFGQNGTFSNYKTAGGNADGAGIGNFFYSPPSGFKALCSKNLPSVTIKKPTEHFNTILYTGNDTTNNITGVGFQPDLVWLKNRSQSADHMVFDAVRGSDYGIRTNTSVVESDQSANFTGFASDGFNLADSSNRYNDNGENYVAWNWKANGSGSANTDGSINSTVSANTTAGFSIVTYTGTGSNATVGHGLGVTPSVILVKNRESATNWLVYSRNDATDYLVLNDTRASTDWDGAWNDTAPTSSVFSIGTATGNNTNGDDIVAYCFAEVEGFSKFGTYYGNGSANGPYIYTSFQPAWIMTKIVSTTVSGGGDWVIYDDKRDVDNVTNNALYANLSLAESTGFDYDINSNGFKARAAGNDINQSGQTFLYLAFSEFPFKYVNAR